MKRHSLKSFITLPAHTRLDPKYGGFCFGGIIYIMTQLDLFQEPEPKPIIYITPDHHKANGIGNFDVFLEKFRNNENTYVASSTSIQCGTVYKNKKYIPKFRIIIDRFLLSEINDSKIAKRLLFAFNSETKEYDHKPVNNFRINQLLHWIYDSLSEGGNYV